MINERMYNLGSMRSGIRELFEFGQMRAKIVGRENICDFSLGNPSVPCPPEITAHLHALLDEDPVKIHSYTSAQGLAETRRAIANQLKQSYGEDASENDIFMSCGAAAALACAIRALAVDDKSEFLALAPFFTEYAVFVPEQGGVFKVVEPDYDDFDIKVDDIEAALNENTRAILINSPNNPTGHIASRDTLKQLADLLNEKEKEFGHPIYLISDEPYRELVYDQEQVPFLPAIYENTIVCYSYSKTWSLPGERIGYLYIPGRATGADKLMAAVLGSARALGYVCAPSLFQRLVERAIDVKPNIAPYDENRKLLTDGLKNIGYQVVEPKGAFYLFVKVPGNDAIRFSELAKEQDVLVVAGDYFGCKGYVRISYCVEKKTIEKALPRFEKLFKKDRGC